jgi:hypothetical protein
VNVLVDGRDTIFAIVNTVYRFINVLSVRLLSVTATLTGPSGHVSCNDALDPLGQ